MKTTMVTVDFRAQAVALYAGRTTFQEFALATRAHWERLALYIARRWRAPEWHSVEDVVQELLLGAWVSVWNYDPAKSVSGDIASYLVWNAVDKAKKKQHKARGATLHGNADGATGHALAERPISARERPEDWLDVMLNEPPTQEEVVEARERVEMLEAVCETQREIAAIRALIGAGSLAQGAERLYEDKDSCRRLSIATPADAARAVVETAYGVAARLGVAAA